MLRHNKKFSLGPSLVGQLEPPDPQTAKGWRYLQTDSLKVCHEKKKSLLFPIPSLGSYPSKYGLNVRAVVEARDP